MKPKDWNFPTIGDYDRLQLQPVVSEPYPQRRRDRSRADRYLALGARTVEPLSSEPTCKITRH